MTFREIIDGDRETFLALLSEEPPQLLHRGLDFVNGVLYYTFPYYTHEEKSVGRGKNAKKQKVLVRKLITLTSERDGFWYNDLELEKRNLSPDFGEIIPKDMRFDMALYKAWADPKVDVPTEDPYKLFADIRETYRRYVDYDDPIAYDLLSLFVMATYLYRIFPAMPYIHFTGTRGSGKSTNLELMKRIGFNSLGSADMTPSSLFRLVHGQSGTICIDEAESFNSEKGQELRTLLNAGYSYGGTAARTEEIGGTRTVVSYEVYSPKVIASINPLDDTLGSRAVVINMIPAHRRVPPIKHDDKRFDELRNRLYLWALQNASSIDTLSRAWDTTKFHAQAPHLTNRAAQLAHPFLVLADHVGDAEGNTMMLTKLIAWFETYYAAMQERQAESDRIYLLLQILPRVFATKAPAQDTDWWAIQDIHDVMAEYLQPDQREYFKARQVTKHLRTLGITKIRTTKGGSIVQLSEDDIRKQLQTRNIKPETEDEAWLAGTTSYAGTVTSGNGVQQSVFDGYFDPEKEDAGSQ